MASFDFGGVIRVDPATNRVVARIKTGRGPIGVAFGAGSVWVANWLANTVTRIDPATGKALATIKVTATGPEGMAFGASSLWVSNKAGSVSRIDPRTNRQVALIKVRPEPRYLAVGAGSVWVADYNDASVIRADAATGRVRGCFY